VFTPLIGSDLRPLCGQCGEHTRKRAIFRYRSEKQVGGEVKHHCLCAQCSVAIEILTHPARSYRSEYPEMIAPTRVHVAPSTVKHRHYYRRINGRLRVIGENP
jgi:hypothetical protein